MSLHIVFVEPEIPPNTGNIARTCAATDTKLHLVKPLGFKIDDKSLKRAGLDYWPYVKLEVHESLDAFMEKYGGGERRLFLATTKGRGYVPLWKGNSRAAQRFYCGPCGYCYKNSHER